MSVVSSTCPYGPTPRPPIWGVEEGGLDGLSELAVEGERGQGPSEAEMVAGRRMRGPIAHRGWAAWADCLRWTNFVGLAERKIVETVEFQTHSSTSTPILN